MRLVPRNTNSVPGPRDDLRADCARCVGLCCVAPAFTASADFALDKPAGQPCPNLGPAFRCSIHDRLRPSGFRGCAVFDCLGAGQKVAQQTFGGRDWRAAPALAPQMFAVFGVMRGLHELLWLLDEALRLTPAGALRDELAAAVAGLDALSCAPAEALVALDADERRAAVNPLLVQASEQVRAPAGLDRRGADLAGHDLRGADLRRASLRGALLVGADLSHARLGLADLTGADLRGAQVGGADLAEAIFLMQSQLDAAHGDGATRIPAGRTRPAHWTA
jgi:hypothetical protein